MGKFLLGAGVCLVAAAAGYFGFRYWHAREPQPAAQARPPLPAVSLKDLEGQPHGFADWRGKLLLVNFWATWCAPCLKEIPELAKIQAQYGARGLQIVGPAVDDPDAVRSMIKTL